MVYRGVPCPHFFNPITFYFFFSLVSLVEYTADGYMNSSPRCWWCLTKTYNRVLVRNALGIPFLCAGLPRVVPFLPRAVRAVPLLPLPRVLAQLTRAQIEQPTLQNHRALLRYVIEYQNPPDGAGAMARAWSEL